MKKSIIMATLFVATICSAFASGENPSSPVTKEITTSKFIKSMIIGYNVGVTLVADDNYSSITLTGDKDVVDAVNVKVKGTELYIWSVKNLKNRQVLVHVPMKDLAYMELKSGSKLYVQGVIPCRDLTVVVNSEAHLDLKYLGKATVKPGDDCEFVYEKQ